jgi:hypothetical protein
MYEMWGGDRPVLVRVAALYEVTGKSIEPLEPVLEAFPDDQHDAVRQSLRRLGDHGYIDTVTAPGMGQSPQTISITRVTEKGLRAVGAYPASDEQAAKALLAAIDEAAENSPDAQERTKLKAFGSAFAALGTNAGGGIAAAAFAKLMGWM